MAPPDDSAEARATIATLLSALKSKQKVTAALRHLILCSIRSPAPISLNLLGRLLCIERHSASVELPTTWPGCQSFTACAQWALRCSLMHALVSEVEFETWHHTFQCVVTQEEPSSALAECYAWHNRCREAVMHEADACWVMRRW